MNDDIEPPVKIVNRGEVEPVFVDWFLTVGTYDGTVTAILGSIDPSLNADGIQNVRVGVSMKMSVAFAERFSALLADVVSDAKNAEAGGSAAPSSEAASS